MERKSTGQLNQELMQASSLGEYVSENRDAFSEQAVSQLLSELYEKSPSPRPPWPVGRA